MVANSSMLSRRTVLASFAVLGLALLATWYFARDASPAANSAEAPVVVLSDSPLPLDLPELEGAQQVESVGDLRARLEDGAAVVVVEFDTVSSLAPGELSFVFDNGSALLGLNVPIDRLNQIAGFESVIGAMNPKFREGGAKPGSFAGEFFSLVWATAPGQEPAYWSRLQQDMRPSTFNAVLSDYRLRVVGLTRENGRIVPLENYGQDPAE